MRLPLRPLVAIVVLTAAFPLRAADRPPTYAAGDVLAAFTLRDQHDQPFTSPGSARLVIVSFAMRTAQAANAFFARQSADFLAQHRTLFLANIHGMPRFVRSFALPRMRKYPHRILLAEAEDSLARYPQQPDRLTVLTLDDAGKIIAVRFIDAETELPRLFAAQ